MTRTLVMLAFISALAVIVVASRTDQGFFSDPALQMKTVVQFLDGTSTQPNAVVEPGPADISRDVQETMVEWAPGTPLAFVPFVRAGLTPAHAARAVAAVALIAGSIGWTLWFAGFDLPAGCVVAFALFVPWMRFASNALFLYSPEVLVFACVPWVLLGAIAAERTTRAPLAAAALAGLVTGGLYVVKFSAVFVTAGVCLWFTWRMLTAEGPFAGRAARVIVLGVCAAIPVGALSVFNQRSGGAANLVMASLGGHWRWSYPLHAVGLSALMAADLDSLLAFLLLHPVHGVTKDMFWLSVCGLPGGILLIVLTMRATQRGPRPDLARVVFATSIVAILLVWTLSVTVSIEARHLFSAGFAMLPLALAEGLSWWRSAGAGTRRVLALAACVFIAMPLSYGVVSVFAKAWRYPAGYRRPPSGIYNPLLAQSDAASVVDALRRMYDPETDVWYLVEPLSGLDAPGRSIVRAADFMPVELLRSERFLTSRRLRVHALLPPRFEQNGKAAAIRGSFPQATGWTRAAVAGSEYDAWTTVLLPEAVR
jgi:hypothetical protein